MPCTDAVGILALVEQAGVASRRWGRLPLPGSGLPIGLVDKAKKLLQLLF